MYLCRKKICGSLTVKNVAGPLLGILLVVGFGCFVFDEDQLSIIWEKMRSVSSSSFSSSSAPPSSLSWALVVCFVCPSVVGLVVVVVAMGAVTMTTMTHIYGVSNVNQKSGPTDMSPGIMTPHKKNLMCLHALLNGQ